MESAAVLRSFQYAVGTSSCRKSMFEKPGILTIHNANFSNLNKLPIFGGKNISSLSRKGALFVSCSKTSETTVTGKSNSESKGDVLQKSPFSATFPNGFEALLTEVCDETKIAELQVKFGAFEIHMKRKIDSPVIQPIVSQITAPPVPSKPAAPAAPPSPPKPSAEKVSPFTNVSAAKVYKLAALESSGSSGYVIVSSPTVGSFQRARTLKGKKQKPACKQGDFIKEGQIIGYMEHLGTELPVRSDVAGEVLKLLFNDGEGVGYGDPLVAVLPSFPGIK